MKRHDAAKDWLGEHGYDAEFGARPLRRLIQTEVEDNVSDAVLSGQFKDGQDVIVDVEEDAIVLRQKEQDIGKFKMLEAPCRYKSQQIFEY